MAGSDDILNRLERWIAPWKRRILSMIGKCLLTAIDDTGNLQLNQITFLESEEIANIERVQEFGFTSHPPVDSEAVVAFLGGNQNHGVIIATDNSTYRLKNLPDGAMAIYNKNGDYVKLTDNLIEIYADAIKIGKIGFQKLMTEAMISVYNSHTHPAPGGTTSAPNQLLSVGSHATARTEAE